jgi:hypothetical protein
LGTTLPANIEHKLGLSKPANCIPEILFKTKSSQRTKVITKSASGIISERALKIICKEVGAAFQAGFLHIHLHPRLRHGLPPLRLCCLPGRDFPSLNHFFILQQNLQDNMTL